MGKEIQNAACQIEFDIELIKNMAAKNARRQRIRKGINARNTREQKWANLPGVDAAKLNGRNYATALELLSPTVELLSTADARTRKTEGRRHIIAEQVVHVGEIDNKGERVRGSYVCVNCDGAVAAQR